MPELPEVESVRVGVHEWTAGTTITGAEVIDPESWERHPSVASMLPPSTGSSPLSPVAGSSLPNVAASSCG